MVEIDSETVVNHTRGPERDLTQQAYTMGEVA